MYSNGHWGSRQLLSPSDVCCTRATVLEQSCSLQSSPCCIQQSSTISSDSGCRLKTIFKFLSLLFIVEDYANFLPAEDSVWIG